MCRSPVRWSFFRTRRTSASACRCNFLTMESSGDRCDGSRTAASACRSRHRWSNGGMEMSFGMIKARIAQDESERRRLDRVPVDLDAKMRELGSTGIEAKVLNISQGGFMAASEGAFEVGTRVWLMLPGRERANAVIKWIDGDRLGAEFAEPISLKGLEALVASD